MQWETVIGLEVHVQLSTKSKLFSAAATTFGAEPNTQACAVDLGLPGTLPVANKVAIQMAVKFGLAIDADIAPVSIFARKNYFYPDLPKGYQISQYELPIVSHGHLDIQLDEETTKRVTIQRAHLEEDAGKSLHEDFHGMTGIDLNRAGTPLIEIVTEPDLRSAAEAVAYLKTLHTLVRYLKISDANMQEGSFRCDANVSVRPVGTTELGTRTEIKNLNSFKFIDKAINYEVNRQIKLIEDGGNIVQETRLFDVNKGITQPMRSKEEAEDYRYFPDPDLLPIVIDELFINAIRETLPELPQAKLLRFEQQYQLGTEDAAFLVSEQDLGKYFEECTKYEPQLSKQIANWLIGDIMAQLNKENKSALEIPLKPQQIALLIKRIEDKTISGKIAKTIFQELWQNNGEVDAIINAKGLKQITDPKEIEAVIDTILENNPNQLQQYREGKEQLFGFFVGQVMQATKGKANPQQVNTILRLKLQI